jgi:hypothetical protein
MTGAQLARYVRRAAAGNDDADEQDETAEAEAHQINRDPDVFG